MYEERNRIVEENLGLVKKAIFLFTNSQITKNNAVLDEDDLMQIGTIALIMAAQTYEPERGTAFSTYAMTYIRNSFYAEFNKQKVNDKKSEISCFESYDEMYASSEFQLQNTYDPYSAEDFRISYDQNLNHILKNRKSSVFRLGKEIFDLRFNGNYTIKESCERLGVPFEKGKSAYSLFKTTLKKEMQLMPSAW